MPVYTIQVSGTLLINDDSEDRARQMAQKIAQKYCDVPGRNLRVEGVSDNAPDPCNGCAGADGEPTPAVLRYDAECSSCNPEEHQYGNRCELRDSRGQPFTVPSARAFCTKCDGRAPEWRQMKNSGAKYRRTDLRAAGHKPPLERAE